MSVDFDRSAGDNIYANVPVVPRASMLECWFQLDDFLSAGNTVDGHLIGVYASGTGHMAALLVEIDATGFPIQYSLVYQVVNVGGTFRAKASLTYTAGKWYHGLGVWQGGGVGNIYCYLDGVGATTSASTGLALGFDFYGFGANFTTWPYTDYFDGRIAEGVAWGVGAAGTTGFVKTACKGWNPIDRDPFFWPVSPNYLRAWTPLWSTSVYDVMRPATAYTVNGCATYADHPPVFEAPRNEHFPRPPQAAAITSRYCSVAMTPHLFIG